MKKSVRYFISGFVLFGLAILTAFWFWLTALPQARVFPTPPLSQWAPEGVREAGPPASAVFPAPDAFHTMHVNTVNSDEIWTAIAPSFEADWVAETGFYIAEGPTFDNAGNLYFSPSWSPEDVSLVALDRVTGKRRWSIPGKGAGAGAPLVLNDPAHPGQQLIYHSTYTTAMALRPDGSTVWSVPTGLKLPPVVPGQRSQTHMWGMNYMPKVDALVAVSMDGWVTLFDRKTGAPLLTQPFQLPGAPAARIEARIPTFLARLANRETAAAFGNTDDGLGLFDTILDVIYGNGVNVANYYAVDPSDDSIVIAATAPDAQDGKTDGVSANGALYRLRLQSSANGQRSLQIAHQFYFSGGTGSTPTLSANGRYVVVSDDNGNVITLDRHFKELWRLNVGDQVAASVAVAADGNEMFAVTKSDIFKLHNAGTSGRIVWRAQLDAYPGFSNFNALTPTIVANGVVVSLGAGRQLGQSQIGTQFGMGLLDRQTGQLRWFAQGREESIAVTSIGPDGSIYVAHSPVRRAVARGVMGDKIAPLVGGIQRYRPTRFDLLARDASCAAARLAQRWQATGLEHAASRRDDEAQIQMLLKQAREATTRALERGEISTPLHATQQTLFGKALASGPFAATHQQATQSLCQAAQ